MLLTVTQTAAVSFASLSAIATPIDVSKAPDHGRHAPGLTPRQVVERCARVIGLLSRVRLDAVVARFLRELTEAPEPGAPPRLRSDSQAARQELFQLCDGMKRVELAADHSRQVCTKSNQISSCTK